MVKQFIIIQKKKISFQLGDAKLLNQLIKKKLFITLEKMILRAVEMALL